MTAAMRSNEVAQARLGLAISARAVPAATDRNRIKRLTRETFRAHRARLPAIDVVMLARPGAGSAPRPDLRAALDRLWRKMSQAAA